MDFVEIEWQSDRYEQEIELRDRLLRAPLGLTFTPGDLHAEQHQLHFGMTVDSQLIACLVVVPLEPTHAKIRQMCVEQSQQKQGIGTLLMTSTEAELIQRGIKSIELNARDIAVGFYERLGYLKMGDEFIEVTIPHYRMMKQIAPQQ